MRSFVVLLVLVACGDRTLEEPHRPNRNIQGLISTGPSPGVQLSAGVNFLDSVLLGFQPGTIELQPHANGSTVTGIAFGDDPNPVLYSPSFGHIHNLDPSLPITIAHHSTAAGADSSNWISTGAGSDVTLLPGEWMTLISRYDPGTSTYQGWTEVVDRSAYVAHEATTPARTIGVAWQPNMVRPTMVVATLTATCALTLIGGQAGHIDMLVGSANPPTTVIGGVPCQNTGAVVIGVNSTIGTGGAVSFIVRPGDFVKIVSTDTVGTPSYGLAVAEETL